MSPEHGEHRQGSMTSGPWAPTRRGFLTVSSAGALSLLVGVRSAAATGTSGEGATQFAMVTDTHAHVEASERTAHLERAMEHIASRDPAFVLNCGDITELGLPEEYDLYRSTIPDPLWERVHHVSGNHEDMWSTDARQSFQSYFGDPFFSFDAAGLHVVGLDADQISGWTRRFGSDQLAWLKEDLQGVAEDTPIVVFLHYPVGNDWNYIYDDEDLLEILEPFPVRAVFTGHTHTLGVSSQNGYTRVTGQSFKDGPFYYWAELAETDSGPVLEVSEVEVPAEGEVSEELLTEIPLAEPSPGGDLGPLSTEVRVSGERAVVQVEPPAEAPVAAVKMRIHPHQIEYPQPHQDGYDPDDHPWTELTGSPGRPQIGRLDISELAPGTHRVQVRAVDDDDGVFDTAAQFEIPGSPVSAAWTVEHAGGIRGALAHHDGLVVAATTTGVVEAYRPTPKAADPQWRTEIGPVHRAPVFTADGDKVLVPSADQQIYALDASTGEQLWHTDLTAPVMSEITLAEVDGQERALAVADTELVCLDLQGGVLWTADLGGVCRGAAACDGDQVYIGSGDGHGYAFDARTGDELWAIDLTERDSSYEQVLYGPWASHVRLLDGGRVLFSTFDSLHALDADTGDTQWSRTADTLELQVPYTPPTITEHGILAFDGYDGTANLVDSDSGEILWDAPVLTENFGAAPAPTSEESVLWMIGQTGRLVRIDLAEQSYQVVLQFSWTFATESTAALIESDTEQMLLVGGEDGHLHGLTGLEQV